MKILKSIVATIAFTACIFESGCGTNSVESLAAPTISAVLPQTIAAGSSTVTMKVEGANFSSSAVILWNGNKLTTSVIDANTLSGAIQGGSLAVPGTAQVQVQNVQTGQASQSVPISIISSSTTVSLPLAVATTSLAAGQVGTAYTHTVSATGGTGPYTWSITSGALPSGLTLSSSTGAITGTPSASGTFSFTATVTDSSSPVQAQSAALSIAIAAAPATIAPLSISTSSLTAGTSGTSYSQTLQATGGSPAYSWSVASGNLPAGLALASSTGVISGTPTSTGASTFTVKVTDSGNPAQSKTASLSITIAPTSLAITSTTLAAGTINVNYSQTLQATGGSPAYSWSVASGNLPAGLTLASSTGVISGKPTASGTSTFTVKVTDSGDPAQSKTSSLSLTIGSASLAIYSTTLAAGTVNANYSQTLQATGGTPAYSWSVASGNLPAGLTLASATGVISGKTTASGTSTFTVKVTDSEDPAQSKTASLSITVAPTSLAITSTTLAAGTVNTTYTQALQASGGTPTYTWAVTSGSLPSGLALNAASGAISGSPTASGTSNFTITVTDSGSPAQTKSASLSITVAASQLTISSSTLAAGTQSTAYSQTLHATGGTPSYSWTVTSGSLPAGLSLAAATGIISGTPTAAGTFSFTATVTDSSSPTQTKSATTTITIASSQLVISTTTPAAGVDGTAYSQTLHASGGTPSYSWSIASGGLPTSLSLSSAGVISGTPTATGTFTFTVTVTDSSSPAKTQSQAMSITISPTLLSIVASALSSATDGTAYSQTLQATGGTPGYTWSVTSGSLPAGLTLGATTGTISGTPTSSGIATFTLTVADMGSPAQTKAIALSITVAPAPAVQGTTWYIRLDGGTNTQCTGTTNAPYPGTGTNQPCAYNHPYQMLNYAGTWTAMQGGDTIQFEDQGPYYMGEQNNGVGTDWHPTNGNICPQPNGGNGDACNLPILPSGTALNPTRILGANTGSCHNSAHTGLVNPTVLEGINGTYQVLSVQGTNYVQISCIEVTQPDTCTRMGSGAGGCTGSNNYVASAGIMFEDYIAQGPSNLTMQDVAVVGMSGNGILGSHINMLSTDVTTLSDIYIIGNGSAGWSGDGGNCGNSCESVGTINISYMDVDWNGCVAVEPYNMNVPSTQNAYTDCYDDNNGGYGDGFAQIAAGNMTLTVTHSKFRWNTQDGFDSLHLGDDQTTNPTVTITDSWSEGNEGQTFKLGAGSANTAINNVSISNCRVMGTASNFPQNPAGWNAGLSDFCRAAGDEWALAVRNGSTLTLENNTSVGYGTTMYDVECSTTCANSTMIFVNNISKGYEDPGNSNQLASGIYFGGGDPASNPGSVISNNLWNTMRTGCPDLPNETNYSCSDPLLVGESDIDAINPNLTSTSPAIGAGVAITGITADYNGITKPNPPAIGAMEY